MLQRCFFRSLVVVLGLAAPLAGRAQDFQLPLNITGVQMVDISGMVVPDVLRGGSLPDARSPDYKAKMAALNGKKAPGKAIGLAYVPTAALRQQTVQALGNKLQATNPAAGQAFTAAFASGKVEYGQLFQQMVKTSGLPVNNAATALAAYLEAGYAIVNDVQDEKLITPAMDRALQQQAASILSQNKGLTSPAAVARLGEELKLQAVLLALGWQSARQGGQAEQFRAGIAQQFRSQGLDMRLLRLTTQGLVKK